MGKMFGLIVMVIGIWIGLTIYAKGVEGTYQSVLTSLGVADVTPAQRADAVDPETGQPRTLGQQVGDRVTEHLRTGEERIQRQLEGLEGS